MDKFLPDRKVIHRLCSPNPESFRAGPQTGVRIPRMKGTTERQALPPAFMRGEGHAVAGGVPRRSGDGPLSHALRASSPKGRAKGAAPRSPVIPNRFSDRRENPPDERYSGTTSLAPRIYEGGGPRSGRGSPPPQRGKPPQSRFACQLSRRESQGCCAPFLPPAFMRGEGHAVAGGVPRSGGNPLSHASRASSPRGRAKGAAHRSCPPHL